MLNREIAVAQKECSVRKVSRLICSVRKDGLPPPQAAAPSTLSKQRELKAWASRPSHCTYLQPDNVQLSISLKTVICWDPN